MNIDNIIGKLMNDDSLGEEKSALEMWKKQAEENVKALDDIRKIDKIAASLPEYEDFSADEAWNNFDANIAKPEVANHTELPKKANVFSLPNLMKYAAVLVLAVGALYFVNNQLNNAPEGFVTETYASIDAIKEIRLEEGTEITLDAQSSLSHIAERSVTLNGRAFFDVAKVNGENFIIDLPVGNVEVLGTQFSIKANDHTTEVYVKEGRVRYTLDNRKIELTDGDQIIVKDNEIVKINNKDKNALSWRTKKLVFRNDNGVDVMKTLVNHFDKEIIVKDNSGVSKCKISHVFENATLEEILNEFTTTLGLKYELKDDKIYIVSSSC